MTKIRPLIFICFLLFLVVFFGAFRLGRSASLSQIQTLEKLLEKKVVTSPTVKMTDPIDLLNMEKKQLGCGINLLLPKNVTQKLKLDKTEVYVGEKIFLTYSCDEGFIKDQNLTDNAEITEIASLQFNKIDLDGNTTLYSSKNNIFLSFPINFFETVKVTLSIDQITPPEKE